MTLVKFKNGSPKSFNNLIDDFLPQFPSILKDDFSSFERHFTPVNIKEKEKGYSLEVVAPGFTKEDFRISLEKDLLTISAEKKSETDNNSEKLILKEYSFKSFKRSFTVSDDIDIENIEAKYENGVLLINLPRKEQVKETTKQISIQ